MSEHVRVSSVRRRAGGRTNLGPYRPRPGSRPVLPVVPASLLVERLGLVEGLLHPAGRVQGPLEVPVGRRRRGGVARGRRGRRVAGGGRGAVGGLRRGGAVGVGGRAVAGAGGGGAVAGAAAVARLLVVVTVQQQVDDEDCKGGEKRVMLRPGFGNSLLKNAP